MRNKSFLMTVAMLIIALSSSAQENGTFTDHRDGKSYRTVKIGKQIWMAENFAYKANSGCWAYDNNEINVKTYGYLYNYESAQSSCPSGWHIPSSIEWDSLVNYLGGKRYAGSKLISTTGWKETIIGATNSSHFTGLPAGYRNREASDIGTSYSGAFFYIGYKCYWWSSTPNSANNMDFISEDLMILNKGALLSTTGSNNSSGFSVRYVKDY